MGFADNAAWESALVVPVPAAEPAVSHWRRLFDPAARWGVPAHVTVLYPFLPPVEISEATTGGLRDLFSQFGGFEFTLGSTGRFGEEVLFLRPEPADRFLALTEKVVEEWPDFQPYGGIHEGVVPHLTVAVRDSNAHFDRLEADLASHMPILAYAESVSLMVGCQSAGSWRTLYTIPLD